MHIQICHLGMYINFIVRYLSERVSSDIKQILNRPSTIFVAVFSILNHLLA